MAPSCVALRVEAGGGGGGVGDILMTHFVFLNTS